MWYWLFRHRLAVVATILIILPILVMYFSGNSRSESGVLESVGGVATGWTQTGVGEVVDSVDGISSRVGSLFAVSGEVNRLRSDNERLLGEALRARRLASENRELRLLLGLRESRDDLKLAPAEIVVRDVNPFFRIERMRLKLAASTNQSRPASGNAVITDIGLVGRITEIRGSFADVMLVSDYRSRVAAQVNGTGVIGMVVGSGRKSGYLARLQVSMSEPALLKGAVVVTSGHDRVFPRGIEIGYILDPEARRQVGPFMEYDVALAVDPSLADVVMVVTELAAAEALDAFEVR